MAKIAILGYGTVGSGVYEIFANSDFSKKTGEAIEVAKILDIRDFPEHPRRELFTKEFSDILNDGEIVAVAETMGGCIPRMNLQRLCLRAEKMLPPLTRSWLPHTDRSFWK